MRGLSPHFAVKVGSQKLGWTLTDAEGRYTIRGLAPGSVSIGIQGDREMMETVPVIPRTVNVSGGRDTPGNDFRVRIDANGGPLSGIKMTVFHREYQYRSAAEGAFTSSDQLSNAFPVADPNAGTPDEMGIFVATGLRPEKYYVFATNNPPSNQVMRLGSIMIERTPEALEFLRTARLKGTLVDITPGLHTQVLLVPKD